MNRRLLQLVLVAMLISTAAVVQANDKLPDWSEAVPGSDLVVIISGTLGPNSATWDRVFGGALSLDCNSQVMDSGSDGQYFDAHCIQVTTSAPIEAIVDENLTTIGDTTMTLYCDAFNPVDPLNNVVLYDDDDGAGLLSAFTVGDGITLTPGDTYWLVLSTFSAGDMGDYQINLSDNVVVCGSTPVEAGSWGQIKALF